MKRFSASVQHITGQELDVRAASEDDSMSVVEEELESLRAKVDELSDEVTSLCFSFS
jgi:diaphanous 1